MLCRLIFFSRYAHAQHCQFAVQSKGMEVARDNSLLTASWALHVRYPQGHRLWLWDLEP